MQPLHKSKYFINTNNVFPSKVLSDPIYSPLDSNDILPFHESLPNYKRTSLYTLKNLAKTLGVGTIYLKNENERYGLNAFKALGASYASVKMMTKEKEKNPNAKLALCTATDGNHGRAVAWTARITGATATIFVPHFTKEERIENIKKEGAKVVISRGDYDVAVNDAYEESKKHNMIFVQDMGFEGYIDIPLLIMAGYTTVFNEVIQVVKDFDIVFLQAGVGSFASAMIYAILKQHAQYSSFKKPKIVVVEPYEVDCCMESIKEDTCVKSKGKGETIMAGLNCMTPSSLAIPIIKYGCDLLLAVDDFYAVKAMNMLYRPEGKDVQVVAGESGAGGMAGLIALMTEPELQEAKESIGIGRESKVLVVSTEGDTDKESFRKLVIDNADYA